MWQSHWCTEEDGQITEVYTYLQSFIFLFLTFADMLVNCMQVYIKNTRQASIHVCNNAFTYHHHHHQYIALATIRLFQHRHAGTRGANLEPSETTTALTVWQRRSERRPPSPWPSLWWSASLLFSPRETKRWRVNQTDVQRPRSTRFSVTFCNACGWKSNCAVTFLVLAGMFSSSELDLAATFFFDAAGWA